MKISKELRAKLAAEQDKVKLMLAVIEARKDSPIPTDEETAAYDAAVAEIRSLKSKIEKFEADKDIIVAATLADQDTEERAKPPVGRQTVQVEVVDKKEPVFKNLPEQLAAIVMVHPRNPKRNSYIVEDVSTAYNKLVEVKKRHALANGTEFRAPAGASTLVDSDGGYLLQPDIAQGIWMMSLKLDELVQRCNSVDLKQGSKIFKMFQLDESSRATGSRYGGVTSSWVNEGDAATASRPKMKVFQVQADKLMSMGYATHEMLVDADAMASVMTENFAKEQAFQAGLAVFSGLGGNQPLGITSPGNKSLIVVAKDSGQATGTLSATNLLNMRNRMLKNSWSNAVWVMNPDLEALLPQIALATGTYSGALIYMPAGGLAGNQYDTLFGRPIIFTEYNPSVGSQADVVLADFSMYQIVKKNGPRSDSSIHVNFSTDEIVFRLISEIGGKPLVEKPITPFSAGSNTRSPFVALAARP